MADLIRVAAAGSLKPEWLTEKAREEKLTGWKEVFSGRLQNAGDISLLELLEIKVQDGVSRRSYRA